MKSLKLELGNLFFFGCPNGVPAHELLKQGRMGVGGTYVASVVGSTPLFLLNCD
jgi:hypothetical protein